MSIVSYAQNFEDVMLWRALGHISKGYYIDVGAQDPVVDSVSLAFYEKGWRGLHVEPTPHYAELLRQQRPGDTVVQAAIGNGPAEINFFEIPHTGISTAEAGIAEQHRQRGFDVHEISVHCVPLSAIFKSCSSSEIHWLKIDVEGFEGQVLSSWGKSKTRPWIVVVESTLPLTQTQSHASWEPVLLGYGYEPVYFDGLNRYYLSVAHLELKVAFDTPPNVFDDFSLNGTASAPFHRLLDQRHKTELNGRAAQDTDKQAWSRIEKMLVDGNETTQQALERLLRSQEDRTQEIATQFTHVLQQAAKDTAALLLRHEEQVELLRRKCADQEIRHAQRIRARQEEIARINDSHRKDELKLVEQLRDMQAQTEHLLRKQAQREQDIAKQLFDFQQMSAREKHELAQHYKNEIDKLHSQSTKQNQEQQQQLELSQTTLCKLQIEKAANELDFDEKLLALQLHFAKQEQQHDHQIADFTQRLESTLNNATQREHELKEQTQADRFLAEQQFNDQIRILTKREQELSLSHEKSEASVLQRLNASEQLRLKLAARQDLIESAFSP
jgi:FkbM family methyltransferase